MVWERCVQGLNSAESLEIIWLIVCVGVGLGWAIFMGREREEDGAGSENAETSCKMEGFSKSVLRDIERLRRWERDERR